MRTRAHRRPAVVLILLLFLVPTVLRAAPHRITEPSLAERAGVGLLDLVRSVLSALGAPIALTGDNGSGLDPNGDQVTGDNGSGLDPDGRL
jgi:hypothetical protein